MKYSTVIASGLLRPKKARYTVADCERTILDSLFNPFQGRTLTRREARFVIKCSATYHGTDYSKAVSRFQ